jgi:hypothetical protein
MSYMWHTIAKEQKPEAGTTVIDRPAAQGFLPLSARSP